MTKGSLDWLHELAKDWGDYCRRHPSGFSGKSTEHKLFNDEVSLPPGPSNPQWRQDADVMEFHVAWRQLPEKFKMVLWALYVLRGEPAKKAARIGMSQANMYKHKGEALTRAAMVMAGADLDEMKEKYG